MFCCTAQICLALLAKFKMHEMSVISLSLEPFTAWQNWITGRKGKKQVMGEYKQEKTNGDSPRNMFRRLICTETIKGTSNAKQFNILPDKPYLTNYTN